MADRVVTDYEEVVTVGKDEHGDVEIQIVHGIQSTSATLRPSQADALAELLTRCASAEPHSRRAP